MNQSASKHLKSRQIAISQRNVETIARIQREAESRRTFGERIADNFAQAIGSWTFIITQSILLIAWVVVNVVQLIKPWDPYPFILLNLALSFQAAYASPIIMMSQNRQSKLADQRNQLALQLDLLDEQEGTETVLLLRKICTHLGIPHEGGDTDGLAEATDPNVIFEQIKQSMKP